MKAFLSWFCDPYVHVLLIGFVVINLASSGNGGADPAAASTHRAVACPRCGERPETAICRHVLDETYPGDKTD